MWNWVCSDAYNLGGIEGSKQAPFPFKVQSFNNEWLYSFIRIKWNWIIFHHTPDISWHTSVTAQWLEKKWQKWKETSHDATRDCSCMHIKLALPATLITCWSTEPVCMCVCVRASAQVSRVSPSHQIQFDQTFKLWGRGPVKAINTKSVEEIFSCLFFSIKWHFYFVV